MNTTMTPTLKGNDTVQAMVEYSFADCDQEKCTDAIKESITAMKDYLLDATGTST